MSSSPFPRLTLVPASIDRTKFLVRRFYPQASDGDAAHPKVAVATGFAPEGGLALQELAGLSAGDAKALVARASANATQGPREWQVAEQSGFLMFKKPSLLRGMGDSMVPVTTMSTEGGGIDDLASDLILDEGFMATASTLLGSDQLIAVVPKRGWLMVGRCMPGELPVMMKFAQMAEGIAGRGGRHALGTCGYFLAGGKVVGVSGKDFVSLLTNHDNPWNLG